MQQKYNATFNVQAPKMNAPNVIKRDTITNSTNSHARAHIHLHINLHMSVQYIYIYLEINRYCHRCDNIGGIFIIYLVNNIGNNMNNNIGGTFIFTL